MRLKNDNVRLSHLFISPLLFSSLRHYYVPLKFTNSPIFSGS